MSKIIKIYQNTMYIWLVDLKVLVRSFNCESRACYVGTPRKSCFSSSRKPHFVSRKFRESNILIREEWPFPDKGILINTIYIPEYIT